MEDYIEMWQKCKRHHHLRAYRYLLPDVGFLAEGFYHNLNRFKLDVGTTVDGSEILLTS